MQSTVVRRVAMMAVCVAALHALGARDAMAQTARSNSATPSPTATSGRTALGPELRSLPEAVQAPAPAAVNPAAPSTAAERQYKALMVLGGAALLVGALVGGKSGTVIMVGGGMAGLYGLYKYLQ